MGVNANFTAEFGSFLNAVAAADVALADFGKGAENVELKLNNMVDKWSGRALIQQANELVIAIDKVGGATALTTTEQTKLNATLNEAIAKYKAIGEDVPPEMQALADATKQVEKSVKSTATEGAGMGATLQSIATSAAAAFSVQQLAAYVGKLIDGASALNTLSAQTRINVEDLQVLAAATASYGVTGDELGRSLFALQSRIAGGDTSVASAYARMGIALDDVKGKNAQELFLMTERALGQLEGAARDAAAVDLYGGKLGASMAAFSTGVDKAVDDAKRLNKIASEESVKAMAEYGDAINRTKASIDALVTEGLGKLAQGFNTLNKAANDGAGWGKTLLAWAEDMVGGYGNLTKVIDDQNKKTEESARVAAADAAAQAKVTTALDERGRAEVFMATLEKNTAAALADWQIKDLDRLRERNELTAQNAAAIGVNTQQLDKYKAGIEAAKKAADDLAKAQHDADAAAMDAYSKRIKGLESITQATLKAYSFDGQIAQLNLLIAAEEATARATYDSLNSAKDRGKVIEDLLNREIALENQKAAIQAKQAGVVNQQVIDELTARTKLADAYGQNVDGTVKVVDANAKLQKSLDDLHAKKQAGISQYAQEQVLMDQYVKDLNAETDATTGLFTEVGKTVKPVNDMGDALDNAGKKAGGTKKSVDELTGSIALAHAATASLADLMDSYFPQGTNGAARLYMASGYTPGEAAAMASGQILSLSSSGIPGKRAAGGPVDAGAPYIVGERGPELFVPSSAGNITPNGGGGLNVTIQVTSPLGTPDAIARAVGSAFMSVLKSQGTRLPLGAMGSSA